MGLIKKLIVVSILLTSLVIVCLPFATASTASITLSPSSCLADPYSGNSAHYVDTTVSGSGFAPNSQITLTGFIEEHYTSAMTGSSGSFSAPLVLFPRSGAGPGEYTITATDGEGNSASAVFEVISNPMCSFCFVATGLPDGTTWSATFDGETQTGTVSGGVSGLVFYRPAGTYSFTIPNVNDIAPSPSSGTITAAGTTQWVSFGSLYPTPESSFGTLGLLVICIAGFLVWMSVMKRKKSSYNK